MTTTDSHRGAAPRPATGEGPSPAAAVAGARPTSVAPPAFLLPADRRRAPIPVGPITGKRTRWRRCLSMAAAAIDRLIDRLPPGRWLHAMAQRRLEMRHVDLTLQRGGSGLHGLTIALLTDIHAGCCMGADDLRRLFTRVMEFAPDLVCLGGDLINTRESEIDLFAEPLALLRPRLGTFAVPGNHDHYFGRGIARWTAVLEASGVRVLCNDGVRIERDGSALWLCGIDDLTEATPDLAAALHGWNGSDPVVLLAHHPDFFFEAAAVGVDVTLSGHTHGGQIVLFGQAVTHSRFGWRQGRVDAGGPQLYVSRGVGTTLLPIRYNAPPELPIVRLRAPSR